MKYDFIIFSPFNKSRFIGAYKIAKVLRDEGYTVKVIDFLLDFLKDNDSLFSWLREHTHKTTVFGFSGTFLSFAIITSNATEHEEISRLKFELLFKYSHRKFPTGVKMLGEGRRFFLDTDKRVINPLFESFFESLKSNFPKSKTVIGGAGLLSKFIYNKLPIDHLIVGYGEDAAKKELVSIFKGEKVPDEVYQNPFELKYDFHNSGNTFHSTEAILPNEVLPLEVSRGCRFKCKFCGFALLGRKMTDEYVRTRNNIFNELMHNYENFGTTDYNILCDTFNESNEKLLMMKEIFDEFNKITGEQIQFNCYARLELIHRFPEQISMLRDMGIVGVTLGIETLHYPSAKAVGKGIRPEDVYKTVSAMKKSWGEEAKLHSGFILGLPHETRETANEWLTSLYNGELDLTTWKLSALRINTNRRDEYLVSTFDKEADKYGYKMIDNKRWENDHWSFDECDDLSARWAQKYALKGIVKFSDHPWGYMNYKNGIIDENHQTNDKIFEKYCDNLFQ
ncbi:MAG: radical SAM protein [Nitrososphaerales archaeon]|nr:radical SAM protein [Nitrososphaerales archaeon]